MNCPQCYVQHRQQRKSCVMDKKPETFLEPKREAKTRSQGLEKLFWEASASEGRAHVE